MTNRQEEINFVMDMIWKLCEETKIHLIPMKRNNITFVGIHDNIENKDYAMIKQK